MIIKQRSKAYVGIIGLLLVMFCNLSLGEAEIQTSGNEKKLAIESLWSQDGGGEQVSLFIETVRPIMSEENGSGYSAVLMSEWSPAVKAKIADRLIREGELPEVVEALKGTSYQVELDAKRHKYRTIRVGMVDDQNQVRWLGAEQEEEWQNILGSPFQEQFSELFIWIYENKVTVYGPDGERFRDVAEDLIYGAENVWVEFDRSLWGRYFFLPSELKWQIEGSPMDISESDELGDSVTEARETIQVLVRSDWSLRAQKEAPEGENWWRKRTGLPVISELNKTQQDYMIWELDFKNKKRRYVAGVYLTATGERIFKEGDLSAQPWEEMGNANVAGIVAAWLLSHSVEAKELPLAAPGGQGEIPSEWAGKN